jgi:hypothetical protein
MDERINNHPFIYALINLALGIVLTLLICKIYFKDYIDDRIDHRIINEYQQPILNKLDTLINYYEDGR